MFTQAVLQGTLRVKLEQLALTFTTGLFAGSIGRHNSKREV